MGHPSPRLLRSALAVALILDISLPLTLGVVPGPACVNCSWPAIASAWPATPQGKSSRDRFFVGESCFDLLALALLRALTLAACLAALLHRRTSARAPALEPLRAPPLLPPRPAPLFVRYAGRACALAALLYSAAKGFTRLLQSGEGHGVGFGLLVHAGTTPPALEFWLCLTGAALLAEAEARAYEGLILAAGAGRAQVGDALEARSADLMNKKGTRTADAAAEAANAVKEAYCKRTAPAAAEVQAMRYCFRLMRRDWKLLLLAYVSLVLAAAGESSVPLLYGKVIDAIAIHPDLGAFHLNILLLLGVALFTGIFTGLRGSTFLLIGGRFSKRLRQELFDALLQQELDFFGATKTGDVTSRLSADCQKVGDQVTLNVNVFLRSVIQVCFTLGFMVVINWRLAATCFVVVPAIVWASKVFGEFYRALSTETQDALAEANSTAEEVISSISTTHAFAAEKEESCRYADGMSTYLQCVKRQAKLYFFYSSATFTFLPYSTYCLVLFYGAQLINTPEGCSNQGSDSPTHVANCSFSPSPPPALAPRCELDSPGLVSFVFYMQSLFSAFQQLGSIYTALAQAAGAADKVCTWIKRKPALPHAAPLVEPTVCRGELRLDDVSFRYSLRPDRLILDHLSFCAKPGEVIALCGPSGGGKSSIIALIARFYDPEAGRVLLDGVPVRQLSPQWFYGQVALVGQEPVLYARSIADNICYGLQDSARPDFSAVVAAASLANADSFICGFEHGYETMIGERGTQLSGGQKQRVAIARALVRKPAVLLLDEATSALDADSEAVVQEAIDQMIAQGGMTVLVIAHRLSTIRGADCILVIKDGRVCEQGTNAQLLESKGEYSKLVQKQMHVHQPMAPTTPSASRHCFPIG